MTRSRKTQISNIVTYSCGALFFVLLILSEIFDGWPANGTAAIIEGAKAGLFGAVIGQIGSRIVLAFVKTDEVAVPERPAN